MLEFVAMSWQWILLSLIVIVVLAIILLTKPVQVGLRTAATMLDLGASYKRSVKFIPKNILISEVTYSCGDGDIVADLYRPNDQRRHSGLILAHGAIKDGKNDRALWFAGRSLARAGYVVLVPQLDNLGKFRLHQDDVEVLVASFQYLDRQEFSNGKIGMFGVCLSAPLALLAATEPGINQDVAVVSSWGGFYNINDWLQAVISGRYIDEGMAKPWRPRTSLIEETPKWLIELLPDPSDRGCIEEMLRGNSLDSDKSKLSPSGQALYELLSNRDPERVGDLWARLDPKIRQTLDSLSPHTKIAQLKTKIAIIHTFADDVIPWVESCKLADAIDDAHKIYFRVFGQFYHASIEDLLKVRMSNLHNVISEVVQFYRYMYSILYRL
ncbi:dienelactone hydrolase family protein [Chloroflexota bacterium]